VIAHHLVILRNSIIPHIGEELGSTVNQFTNVAADLLATGPEIRIRGGTRRQPHCGKRDDRRL